VGSTNIEKVRAARTKEELREWAVMGGQASGLARAARASLREKLEKLAANEDVSGLVKGMILGDLPEAERKLVRSMVPDCIPDCDISPLTAMVYSGIARIVRSGDMAQLERLLRISGETAELRVKLSNDKDQPFELLNLAALSDQDLRKLADRERPQEIIDLEPEEIIEQDLYEEELASEYAD
jgi:hypothetical protein